MKIAYFECTAGVSGDMILGALIDAGLTFEGFKADLSSLPIDGWRLQRETVQKQGVKGTKITVNVRVEDHHRHLRDILQILKGSGLPEEVKKKSAAIFTRLALAEAKVHGTDIEKVHFHEVGAVDAIIDVVGAVCALFRLGVEKVYSSPVHTGRGWTRSAHGVIPVPAPATLALLHDVPHYDNGIEKELTTPTGAAILTTCCHEFGAMPRMRGLTTGCGAGDHDLTIPNVLRVTIGMATGDSL